MFRCEVSFQPGRELCVERAFQRVRTVDLKVCRCAIQLLRDLARTLPVECTCSEAYRMLDQYAGAVAQGRDAAY